MDSRTSLLLLIAMSSMNLMFAPALNERVVYPFLPPSDILKPISASAAYWRQISTHAKLIMGITGDTVTELVLVIWRFC